MTTTKPFFKQTSFVFLLTGLLLALFGIGLIMDTFFFETKSYPETSLWSGILFGLGISDMMGGLTIRQLEKKLDAKNAEQKTTL